jgi:hypothetical protein
LAAAAVKENVKEIIEQITPSKAGQANWPAAEIGKNIRYWADVDTLRGVKSDFYDGPHLNQWRFPSSDRSHAKPRRREGMLVRRLSHHNVLRGFAPSPEMKSDTKWVRYWHLVQRDGVARIGLALLIFLSIIFLSLAFPG